MRRRLPACLVGLSLALATTLGWAAPWRVSGSGGLRLRPDLSPRFMTTQLDVLHRWGLLRYGLGVGWHTVVTENVLQAHALAGLALPIAAWELNLLGVVGGRHYDQRFLRSPFADNPGTDAQLGLAGARAELSYTLDPHTQTEQRQVFVYGGWSDDLGRVSKAYGYYEQPDCFLCEDEATWVETGSNFGLATWSVGVGGAVLF